MFQGSHHSPLKERLLRGIAFLFLLFTIADVTFPPACCETDEIPSSLHSRSAQVKPDATDHTEAVGTSDSGSEQSSETGCCDEDCCFLCAHVLSPIPVTEVAVMDLKSWSITPVHQLMPEPPLRSTFHPPRFA
jgi:hypothetical protein